MQPAMIVKVVLMKVVVMALSMACKGVRHILGRQRWGSIGSIVPLA